MPSSVIDPLELLTAKEDRKPSFLSSVYNPAASTAAGFGLACMLNWGLRKPIFSGIQNHVGFALLGLLGGTYLDKKRNEELATRDAILRHYVQLHPEDFPPIQRKKYADVLEQWVPIR
ncbi:NADH dehydrogenase [ubiquinone] 1 subunit C2 [Stomoxys calcitrans]|uniref:NADH dehydrogenase [ubiquinone] 1 subunit C2 n=1 Tax=Stomoxys calcitrans TaxID=35570 RepID=A0A1I8P3R5_STOCA|nr:NADH dehydrogenase [ubiquinone] 1 subunit C2 [Stomoxys calcitrans]